MASYRVRNLVNGDHRRANVTIDVQNDTIAEIRPTATTPDGLFAEEVSEYAIPGFIDVHTHGALGYDLMDGTNEAFEEIAGFHLRNGTTTFLGSTLTASPADIEAFLQAARRHMAHNRTRSDRGLASSLAGIHLEGPWISPRNLGAQNPRHVREPEDEAIGIVREYADIVRMVTFSYHTAGAERLLDLLVELGIVAASGHDEAIDQEILRAFERGMSHLTHIYCNSSSFQRRDGYKHLGSLEMSLMTPGVSVEVIADDRHITRYFWDFITHNKAVEDLMLVTDSTRGAGLSEDPDRIYKLGELDIVIDDGVAWLADRTTFAGSTSTMLRMFRTIVGSWGVDIQDAVRMTSYNQARKFGIAEVEGGILPGRRADLLFLNRDLSLRRVVKSGHDVSTNAGVS